MIVDLGRSRLANLQLVNERRGSENGVRANGNRGGPSDGADARATRTFLVLARHRHRVTIDSIRSRRPSRRYEDLCLTLALGRLQRDCLTSNLGAGPEFGILLRGVDQALLRQEVALRRMRRWLLPRARRKAEARARQRREAIAVEVRIELRAERRSSMILGRRAVSDEAPPRPAPGVAVANVPQKPRPEPAVEPKRCIAPTRRGTRCRHAVKAGRELCAQHGGIAAKSAPSPNPSRAPAPRPARARAVRVTAYGGSPNATANPGPSDAIRALPPWPTPRDRHPALELAPRERHSGIDRSRTKGVRERLVIPVLLVPAALGHRLKGASLSRPVQVAPGVLRDRIRWERVKSPSEVLRRQVTLVSEALHHGLRGVVGRVKRIALPRPDLGRINASLVRAVGTAVALAALLAWSGLPFSDENAPNSGAGEIAPQPAPAVVTGAAVTEASRDARQSGGDAANGGNSESGAVDLVASTESAAAIPTITNPFTNVRPAPLSSPGSADASPPASGPEAGPPPAQNPGDEGPLGSAVEGVDDITSGNGVPTDISGDTGAATGPVDKALDDPQPQRLERPSS